MEKPPFVAARLRLRRDADIIKALEEVEQGDVSELVRKGLRMALNIVKQPKLGQQQPAESAPEQQKNQPDKLVWKL